MKYSKISVKSASKAPFFIGSQIRGALGHALKKVVCINYKYKCSECFASNSCLYYDFYEQKNAYHNYRLDYELGADMYDFSVYLFEDACDKTTYVISSLYLMLSEFGLGKDRIKHEHFSISLNDTPCLISGKITLPKKFSKDIEINGFCADVSVEFATPLRIKKDNAFIKDDKIELKDIINSIYARQMKILAKSNKRFAYEIKGEIVSKDLRFLDLRRYSNRQQTAMNIGGIIGKIELRGLNKECYEVLRLGEILGAGKQTAFGLGKIKVKGNNNE
nr:CRISPR system precrRNA processing endoribonuclease RAMP protein Cas6 [uncultured Campylobacter sp.]